VAPRQKHVLPKTRTPEEWATFFGCIATCYPTAARNHALLYLTYVTGLRIGETLALRLHDVDLDLLKVHVTRGKTGERIVPLPDDPKLTQPITRWLQVRKSWPTSDLLFVTRSGETYQTRRGQALYGALRHSQRHRPRDASHAAPFGRY
jgi:site-specific recombinase XerC